MPLHCCYGIVNLWKVLETRNHKQMKGFSPLGRSGEVTGDLRYWQADASNKVLWLGSQFTQFPSGTCWMQRKKQEVREDHGQLCETDDPANKTKVHAAIGNCQETIQLRLANVGRGYSCGSVYVLRVIWCQQCVTPQDSLSNDFSYRKWITIQRFQYKIVRRNERDLHWLLSSTVTLYKGKKKMIGG